MSSSQSMYTLYDSKADFYSAPFFAPNQQVAILDFHKLIFVYDRDPDMVVYID
jgi:hypothetical protein